MSQRLDAVTVDAGDKILPARRPGGRYVVKLYNTSDRIQRSTKGRQHCRRSPLWVSN